MTRLVDVNGVALPEVEAPSAEKLRVYGDLLFLAFRSPRHAGMTVRTLRSYLQPAIESGQFRVFRFDDVPRGMFTWAYLNPEAERRLIEGAPLRPEDWNSGGRLWIVDLIAPYKGLMQSIGRWIRQPGNVTDSEFLFRRVRDGNATHRIVHVDFRKDRIGRVLSEVEFLAELGTGDR